MTEVSRKPRVLIVDDDERLRRSLVHKLARWYDISEAANADAALDVLRASGANAFDVLLSDYQMDGSFDGLELMAIARDYYAPIKRMLMSGAAPAQFAPHLQAGVMHAFIAKPCTYEEVQVQIAALLMTKK